MSSKDLENIGSDEEWDMDVADNENSSEIQQTNSVVEDTHPLDSSSLHPRSPSVEMSESIEPRTQKSPVEMDPVSPNDRSNIPEVEMSTAETQHGEDAEMKDLSPEDVGEMKSPSPTVEMLEESAPVADRSPSVPAVEMKEGDELVERELLASPGSRDGIVTSKEAEDAEEAKEEPSNEAEVGDEAEESKDVEKDLQDVDQEKSAEGLEETQNLPNDNQVEEAIEASEESRADEASIAEIAEESVYKSLQETLEESNEKEVSDEGPGNKENGTSDSVDSSKLDMDTSKYESAMESMEQSKSEAVSNREEKETPSEQEDVSQGADSRCESADTKGKESDGSDDIGDRESLGGHFDDDNSQLDEEASKDASELTREVDNMEDVMLPGGADGDVNLEEETGDDPLGASADHEADQEEILGGTDSSNSISILPDTGTSKNIHAGSAEGDEILPDAGKGTTPTLPTDVTDSDTSNKVDPAVESDPKEATEDKEADREGKDDEEKETDSEKKPEKEEVESVKEPESEVEKKEEEEKEPAKEKEDSEAPKESLEVGDGDEKPEGEKDEGPAKEACKVDEKASEERAKSPEIKNEASNDCVPEAEVMEIDDHMEDADADLEEFKREPSDETCAECQMNKMCLYKCASELLADTSLYLCSPECLRKYKNLPEKKDKESETPTKATSPTPRLSVAKPPMEAQPMDTESSVPIDPEEVLKRRCSQCKKECGGEEANLSWETMDFCDEECLGSYQKELGSFCANCRGAVMGTSMGKYCVRFGFNVRQFCSSSCLEEFKKGLKVCSYCQRDISSDIDGFLAPMGDKGQFKDFCSQTCMQEYEVMNSGRPKPVLRANCAVCSEDKIVSAEVLQSNAGAGLGTESSPTHKLCSGPCLAAFKFANNLHIETCEMCKKHFDLSRSERQTVYFNDVRHNFCSKTCLNVNTLANRKIVACNWCKVKKYNFDMIRKVLSVAPGSSGPTPIMLCSLNCLALYQVSVSATSTKVVVCDNCHKRAQGMYHLTMSDATLRNFCCYSCCMAFQSQFPSGPITQTQNPIPTGNPTRFATTQDTRYSQTSTGTQSSSTTSLPVITSVTSLAPEPRPAEPPAPPPPAKVIQQVFTKPPPPKSIANRTTQVRPNTSTKGVSCKPIHNVKNTQTDDVPPEKVLIPIPVPIYVPAPMHMFSAPFPVPVPFPLPIPVPIFIPTTRNSAKGIRKEIKRITEQIPRDPFEAELLMMAEMVAGDKTAETSDSDDDHGADNMDAPSPAAEPISQDDSPAHSDGGDDVSYADNTPSFGDDMLQIALKMATELTEPAPPMDLETALPAMPTPTVPVPQPHHVSEDDEPKPQPEMRVTRKRSRGGRASGVASSEWAPPMMHQKRARTNSQDTIASIAAAQAARGASNGSPPAEAMDPVVEADPNLSLKYTYGVLAFRKWIRQKNAEMLSKSGRAAKLFKTDILQLSTDELNFALCMFVREVRKPDGDEYAPDIIYYLCLGIQLYLYRSHRIDNIFTDAYYEKFTESLNEIAVKFTARLSDRSLVTRVEEEHLWESQQLGAHSPHVLLSTLMYFNTKHFLLTEVEDHMRLSFTHVMKHWKRNHAQPGKTGATRNVLLRYYPPQSVLDADERKKKVYEQQENEVNPLRCPVKLYEFYVSKCPESVRGRNDVFYLLPERSCVPDSPVWYSTMALPRDAVGKMLNRIRMVREVLSLLHSINY